MLIRLTERLVSMAAVLVIVSVISYLLILLTPGDAATTMARQRAGVGATPELVAQIREDLGLDQPLVVQYARWMSAVVRGDLGESLRTRRSIAADIALKLPVTLLLAGGAAVLTLLIAIPAGALAAIRPGTKIDRTIRAAAFIGVSSPTFWVGFLLVLVFSLSLRITPTFGIGGIQSMILPWITLALPFAGSLSLLVRTTLRSEMAKLYATTAYAKGLQTRGVVLGHALPNVLVPLVAVFAAQLGQMIAGAILVEIIFAWPGLGTYFVNSVSFRDIPAIQASVLIFAAFFIGLNALADVAQVWLDPRIRGQARA